MVHAELTIINEQGIHLGPANKIANLADRYDCQIHFKTEYMDVNAKSIINLISGTFRQGDVIQCVCDGPDEKEALKYPEVEMDHSWLFSKLPDGTPVRP